MRTRVADSSGSAQRVAVAVRPSVPGMRMSIRTMSGRWTRVSSTASAPSEASATTSMSAQESMRIRNVARSRAWSSASSTLMLMA